MEVLIVGAGGHGKVVLDILRAGDRYKPVGFIDADTTLAGSTVGGLPVFGHVNVLPKLKQQRVRHAIIAIGDSRARQSYVGVMTENGFELINAIHPAACVSQTAAVGRNTVIAAGAVVCTEAKLGDSVIINTSAVVDHECEIEDGVHVCPAAALAGRVRVGRSAFIGTGARVIPCLSVGEQATVGAGAVVIRDVPAHSTVVGVPARIIRPGSA